ncbi:MAG: ABC transporter substrate-binding protein, partial [Holosporaceae bacterium]|nr:ABC transporter substrate-binding protein [Holosporaceae bacterium]
MKNCIWACVLGLSLLPGCEEKKNDAAIKFTVNADYPPFEYFENGKIVGFDIELAQLVGEKIKKQVVFEDMQFSAAIAAVKSGAADAAISAIAATDERRENFDFTDEYYFDSFSAVYKEDNPVTSKDQLAKVKVICQLGTTMELWLRQQIPDVSLTMVDNNNQAIESLKAGHTECVFMDTLQASTFCKKNPELRYSKIAKSDSGYSIALKKGSPLREEMNKALKELESEG